MSGRLAGKVAIITGAGSGIGFESSVLFAKEGAHVIAADINVDAAQVTVDKIANLFGATHPDGKTRALAVKADVSNEEQIKQLVDQAVEKFGKLNIMFNNAGIMHPEDDNAITTEERIWDLTMSINVKGVWFGCKYAIQAMRTSGEPGSIINTASFVAIVGAATPQLAYTASKGAVLAMTLARTRRRPCPREHPRQLALPGTITHTASHELPQHAREKEPQACACPNGQIW